MEVDKQLKFKSHQRMQVEFISNVDVMTHDFLSSVALALDVPDRVVSCASVLTGGVFEWGIAHRRSVAVLCML